MVKEIGSSSSSQHRHQPYSRPSGSRCDKIHSAPLSEWKRAECVICLEPPHDAVSLICGSFNKGCHQFMCGTCFTSFKEKSQQQQLICSHCRTHITDYHVKIKGRNYLNNEKVKLCKHTYCTFQGNYEQLKKHERVEHLGMER